VWNEDEMTQEQKTEFMKQRVLPRMAKVFSNEANFGCKTCHGPKFEEPEDYLPHLTMQDGKITAFADKPEVARFMAEKVVPQMATALGLQPYDPATQQGFGCAGCHHIDQK
jgi:cytochrome c553